MKKIVLTVALLLLFSTVNLFSQKLLIPMDLAQSNHLKAYGIVFWGLQKGIEWDWLLNYRGGSFATDFSEEIARECRIRGVDFQSISNSSADEIYHMVQSEGVNMDVVRLEKAPKIAVYIPPGVYPWADAVQLAMDYAEVEYESIWHEEILAGKLSEYDWLHLHHEDFTGQYSKFHQHGNQPWYIQQVNLNENTAKKLGFAKVTDMLKAVVQTIAEYVANGGFLFAMCNATETFDIALAAANVDIAAAIYDGDPADPQANSKLNFANTFAFENFEVYTSPDFHPFSNIDIGAQTGLANPAVDYFTLFEFSAKYDPVPTMLTQNHVGVIKGFLGRSTAFDKSKIKNHITILGIKEGTNEVKYLHGNVGQGSFSWLGGHDPEDYQHFLGDPPTDLNMYRSSPGYRLILNNILFPAAKKKKQKT